MDEPLSQQSPGSEAGAFRRIIRSPWLAQVGMGLVALLLVEQAWQLLFPELWLSWKHVSVLLAGLVLASLLLFRLRASSDVQWFCLLAAAALVTLPLWACPLLAILAMRLCIQRRGLASVLVVAFVAGLANRMEDLYGLSGDTLLAILQTNSWEVVDFILANFGNHFAAGFVVQSLVFASYASRAELEPPGAGAATSLLAFGLIVATVVPLVAPVREMSRYVRNFPKQVLPATTTVSPRDLDVVLLLGESTTRWHMQLYGYPYATTPRLIARGDDVTRLTDAISLYSHTVQSVSSLMLRPNPSNILENHSLPGRLRAAGVRTVWYSTQSGLGPWDSPVRQIARDASELKYFQNAGMTLPRGWDYRFGVGSGFTADGDMVHQLLSGLTSSQAGATFWVAHLTVGHEDYCRHIPHLARAVFEKQARGPKYFGDAPDRTDEVNCYDSAMHLLDGMVDDVIDLASKRSRPTLVIFAPDHGEDPDGGTGHSNAVHSARHIEIPVLFYANDAGRRLLGDDFKALKANASKAFALPWLHETVLDAFGLVEEAKADPSRSLLSSEYLPQPRVVFADSSPMLYDSNTPGDRKDYLSRARLELSTAMASKPRPAHVFAHRNDSELALLESMQSFEGVEMDVVFNESTGHFDVYHGPAAPTGFSLERALEIASVRPELLFWFDWKNTSTKNLQAAVNELSRLDKHYHLKDRVWVETTSDYVGGAPAILSSTGFRHSHYLAPPNAVTTACLQDAASPTCIQAASAAARDARQIGAQYVSFDRATEGFGLAVLKADPDLKALTWDLTADASAPGLSRRLASGAYAEVEIVRLPSRFWR